MLRYGMQIKLFLVVFIKMTEDFMINLEDKILYAGVALYNTTVNSLKAQNKFVQSLLSLEEIPDT